MYELKTVFIEHTKGYETYKSMLQTESMENINELYIGVLKCSERVNQEYFNNLEKTIGYGSLFDLVRTVTISNREWNGKFAIGLGVLIGNQEIIYGFYEGENSSEMFDVFEKSLRNKNPTISFLIDPDTGDIQILKENIIQAKPDFKNKLGSYLSSRGLSSQYQGFNLEKKAMSMGWRQDSETPYVDIKVDLEAREVFDRIMTREDTTVVMNKLLRDSTFYLESKVPLELNPYPTNDYHAPAVDTAKLGLLRRNVFGREDKSVFEILDNGRKLHAEIFDADLFDTVGLRFIKVDECRNLICIIQSDGTLIPFGNSKKNLIPYLENGSWSCFYWPSIKFYSTIDGKESFNSFDGLYLFAD